MERRREVRTGIDQEVAVTFLSLPGTPMAVGRILDLSGRGMRLALAEPVAPNTLLKVEIGDRLYLAEVAFCRQADAGCHHVGVHVDQCLHRTPDLELLRRAIQESGLEDRAAHTTPPRP